MDSRLVNELYWIKHRSDISNKTANSIQTFLEPLPIIPVHVNVTKEFYEKIHWRIKGGGARDAHSSPRGPNSFILCSSPQNNRLAHPLWELVPLQENPGSATGILFACKYDSQRTNLTIVGVVNTRNDVVMSRSMRVKCTSASCRCLSSEVILDSWNLE